MSLSFEEDRLSSVSPRGLCLLVGPTQGQEYTAVEKKTCARTQTCRSLGHMHKCIYTAGINKKHGEWFVCACVLLHEAQKQSHTFENAHMHTIRHVLTQRSFRTRTVDCFSSLCCRPLDTTDKLGLTDMGLRASLRRTVGPAGDGHSGRNRSKIRVLVDGADWPWGGGHRTGSSGAGTGGEGPCWKSGGHLSGGQRTWGNPGVLQRKGQSYRLYMRPRVSERDFRSYQRIKGWKGFVRE